eukprot:COSAG01_NODE_1850_length_9063_cov_32.304552_5_plen_82_part_00
MYYANFLLCVIVICSVQGGTDGIPLRKHKEQPQLEPRRRPPSCSRKRLRSTESPVCDEDNTPVKRFRGGARPIAVYCHAAC